MKLGKSAPPHRSFWQLDCQADLQIQPALAAALKCDVAIMGGGYVGLWTAIQLKLKDPGISVCIIDKDICGGAASGRNGGFALSWWPKISSLVKLCGKEAALQVVRDSERAIDEISELAVARNQDIHFRKSGWLWTATSSAQMNAWKSVLDVSAQLGLSAFEPLSPAEIAKRAGSPVHRAGVFDRSAATLHPMRYVLLLKEYALALGVQIFENTQVKGFTRSQPVKVFVEDGEVQCERLVIATNAWAAGIRELSRVIVPITSDMVMTAPAKNELEAIGWTGGEGITDSQMMVDYYHVTKDFRVAFGKGGWGIAYGGHLGSDFERNPARANRVEADLRRYYPQLSRVPVTHDWCGPIDRTPNSLPLMGRLPKHPNIFYGVGWSGNGVAPSVIGGKVLSSLVLDRKDEWASYPLVGRSAGSFPPEPIRYIGAHLVRTAVAAKEQKEINDEKPSFLAKQISKLAPKGLEDKE